MADDKSTTITISWAKVGPAIGLVVFIGGLVTTSVNAAVSVAQYKAQIEASQRRIEEHQTQITRLQEQVTRLSTVQEMLDRLQGRMAELENVANLPRDSIPVSATTRVRPPREYVSSANGGGAP